MTTLTLPRVAKRNPSATVGSMNTIHHIAAYRLPYDRQFWCFDDERFGLHQELFLGGASDFLTRIVGNECERARLIFSTTPFPGHNTVLESEWNGILPEEKGCQYVGRYNPKPDGSAEIAHNFWLCPALCHYFGTERAPDKIYAQITAAPSV